MWKQPWSLVVLASVFAIVVRSSGDCQASELYYFKMNDGKTYVGELLPSDTTIFKIRLKNGDIVDLPFDTVMETGEYSKETISAQELGFGKNADEAGGKPGTGFGIEFGVIYSHIDYKEDLSSGKSEETGWLPGVHFGLNRESPGRIYHKGYIELSAADLDYDGTTWGGTPVKDKSSATFLRLQYNLGYTFSIGSRILVSPYAGYGFRYWNRGLKGAYPYDEDYLWSYIPLGVSTVFALNDQWSIHPGVEARLMFAGYMKVKFDDPRFNEVDFTLGNETGYRFEMPVRYQFSKKWAAIGVPWFGNSKIGASGIETLTYNGVPIAQVYEPASETNQYGFNFTFSYRFK